MFTKTCGLTRIAVACSMIVGSSFTALAADDLQSIFAKLVGEESEYLTEDKALTYFGGRSPGLVITIDRVKIPADLRPEVFFTATDEAGNILAINELTEARFLLGRLDKLGNGSTTRYTSYNTRIENPGTANAAVQATYDSAGLLGLKQKKNGQFRYKFATAIPANYGPTASHQVGGQFRREFGATGEIYSANAVLAFRPDGKSNVKTREIVNTESCNACHTRLSLHGDIRREIQLCIMCHSPQSTDGNSGNTVDMAVMIHKIHMGESLPSVLDGSPYQIVGFGNTVHDYSDVVYPQSVQNCDTCHTSDMPKPDFHLQNPTIAGCASCHDRTWFNLAEPTPPGFTNHPIGVPLTDDSICSACHTPTAPGVAPIYEAHLRPQETSDAPGITFDITALQVLTPDTTPQLQIVFTASDGAGNPIADLNTNAAISMAGTIAYPVSEYEKYNRNVIKGNGASGTLVNNGGGAYTYTFNGGDDALPVGSTDTFAVALEGRRSFTHDGANFNQGTASNARTIFTLNGSEPVERRVSVLEESCNACHGEIRAHGEQRTGVDYCVMCHNPNTTDEARRDLVAPNEEPESVNFKDMLHRIHRGEDLEDEYTVYGFGSPATAHDFTHVRFPGDLRKCDICHEDGAVELPTAAEALSTLVTQNGGAVVREILPQTAACNSCHDGFLPNLHAALNSDIAAGAESCAVCHGSDSAFDIELVHQMEP